MNNIIEKIKSKIPTEKIDWLRISLSFFVTGISFLIADIIFLVDSNNNAIMLISSFCMAIALFCFPYVDKGQMSTAMSKFGFYISYLVVTTIVTLKWISMISFQNINVLLSIIVAIMLIVLIDVTLKPLFKMIVSISQSIKEIANENHNGSVTTMLNCFLANAGAITGFIIAVLTIISTIIELLHK